MCRRGGGMSVGGWERHVCGRHDSVLCTSGDSVV